MDSEKPQMRKLNLNNKKKIEVQLVEIPNVIKNKILVRLDFNSIDSTKLMKFIDNSCESWIPEFSGCGEVVEIGEECIKYHKIGDQVSMELITSWAQFVLLDSENANKIDSLTENENKTSKCTNEECFNNFGAVIGINNNVPAYSNCSCMYKNKFDYISFLPASETGLSTDLNVGVKWQCVEYSRRWLIKNFKVSFEDILFACLIFYLTNVKNLQDNSDLEFLSFKNKNQVPPQFGDLIIYPFCKGTPWGHVAVCTNVDIEKKFIEICEQNQSEGLFWENNSYSRRLTLLLDKEGYYTLTDIPWINNNFINELNDDELSALLNKNEMTVLGWKRVEFHN